jgi:hypothetical protein
MAPTKAAERSVQIEGTELTKRNVIVGSLHHCLTPFFRATSMLVKFVAPTAKR